MKLKQLPDDFYVEEMTDVAPADHGPFAFYRLEKRGWSTPDALAALRRRWLIEPRRISYGGLKDRHAHTIQYLTILHGPRRGLRHHDITVTHLGWTADPYTSHSIRCNRFRLTLRDLTAEAVERAGPAVSRVAAEGVPNYFDDQRFGSVAGEGEEFIARLLVRGRFEDALRLALTAPYEFDRAAQKKEKALLVERWGDWTALKDQLPRGHARSLVDYLRVHPGDFRGAVARLRPELRGLYLSAYQSHLWNRMLARWLTRRLQPEQLRPTALRLGEVPFPVGLDAEQRTELAALQLPLPSSRQKLDATDPRAEVVQAVLAEEGLGTLHTTCRSAASGRCSSRRANAPPFDLADAASTFESSADELHPKKLKLVLSFELPRGCYATLVVKRGVGLGVGHRGIPLRSRTLFGNAPPRNSRFASQVGAGRETGVSPRAPKQESGTRRRGRGTKESSRARLSSSLPTNRSAAAATSNAAFGRARRATLARRQASRSGSESNASTLYTSSGRFVRLDGGDLVFSSR